MPEQASTQEDSAARIAPRPVAAAPWRGKALIPLSGYRLALTFMDGKSGTVDCSSVLTAANPGIYSLLADENFFSRATLDLGVPVWPNGADLDPAWLYDEIAHGQSWSVPF